MKFANVLNVLIILIYTPKYKLNTTILSLFWQDTNSLKSKSVEY